MKSGTMVPVGRTASVLKNFKATLDPDGRWTFGVELEPTEGIADSGYLLQDLPDMIQALGHPAQEAGRCIVFLIDELQYLDSDELSALVMAQHRVNQWPSVQETMKSIRGVRVFDSLGTRH